MVLGEIFLYCDIRYKMYQYKCKKSSECESGNVCDRKERVCRDSKRAAAVSKAVLAKECLRKGIPLVYELGEHRGERKSREALRRCKNQKDRTVIPVNTYNMRMLPAPAVASKSNTPFVRPNNNELKTMRKDELAQVFKRAKRRVILIPRSPSQI